MSGRLEKGGVGAHCDITKGWRWIEVERGGLGETGTSLSFSSKMKLSTIPLVQIEHQSPALDIYYC